MGDVADTAHHDRTGFTLALASQRRDAAHVGHIGNALDHQHIARVGKIMRLELSHAVEAMASAFERAGPTIVVPGIVGLSTDALITPNAMPSSSMASETSPVGSPIARKRSTAPSGGRGVVIRRMRSGAMRPVRRFSMG